ncbi:MAG: hypothetical protein O9322_04895 [Beijerinckiaceae bacterium]|nr:hypothetical protein [Beijerinckiaceae bacterium]MCZ8298858.1 hypothetical protein [Beijerinckiaceae bacterium]
MSNLTKTQTATTRRAGSASILAFALCLTASSTAGLFAAIGPAQARGGEAGGGAGPNPMAAVGAADVEKGRPRPNWSSCEGSAGAIEISKCRNVQSSLMGPHRTGSIHR